MSDPGTLRQLHPLLEQFELAWRDGPPNLGEFAEKADETVRYLAALELAKIDIDHRVYRRLPLDLAGYPRQAPSLSARWDEARAELEQARQVSEDNWRTSTDPAGAGQSGPAPPLFGGRYQVIAEVAAGGEATVYRCVDLRDVHSVVAVKWMRDGALDPKRFLAQMQALREMADVPNVVRVFDCGEEGGRPFIVSEYVRGRTLRDHVQDRSVPANSPETPVAPSDAVRLLLPLARAAARAHALGITHQDITPRNVLVDAAGRPVLIDFGLACARTVWTEGAATLPGGTPEFLAPEQARALLDLMAGKAPPGDPRDGARIDPRTDVFGLGMLLFFLLTGERPYGASGPVEQKLREAASGRQDRLRQALARKQLPARLRRLCLRAVAPDPRDRFASADVLARELEQVLRPAAWARPWYWAAGGAAVLALVVWLAYPRPQQPAEPLGVQVHVFHPDEERYVPLTSALPLRTGMEVQVSFRVPAGMHSTLFSVNGAGQLAVLGQYPPAAAAAEVVWPEAGSASPIRPPVGTEFLFVCARRAGPIGPEHVRPLWTGDDNWPAWPHPGRLLRILPDGMREEGEKGRDFDAPVARPGAEPISRRLERFRERLRGQGVQLEGVAFRHVEE